MKSMTGFAQGRFEFNEISINIMLKSLNHRFLDLNLRGNGINGTTEKIIRETVKGRVFRGKIDITFDIFDRGRRNCDINFNEQMTGEILDKLLAFKERYGDSVSLSMDFLMKIPMLFHLDYQTGSYSDAETAELRQFFGRVFGEFLESRRREGRAIYGVLNGNIEKIAGYLQVVEKEAGQLEQEMFTKFKEKIARYLKDYEIDEKRIAQEAAILAEKGCIREEIDRLITHNQRLKELLSNDEVEVKGREADFLAQEMQRETYTIASKTTSLKIHQEVIHIKREIEKIRQQVQNVE